MAKTKIALLYERLSRDDELQGESCSIQHQKAMLEDYAQRNGFPRFKHFTDDGVSGTRFDRPGFMSMMEEVEDGNVEAIIVKDMSRLGRDYLKVGQVMELLRQRGVRLIAINDNVDSANGDNDFTPFLNIMYEFYARDTSRKIRSVFKAKGMSGKHLTGFVAYGYLWDEKRENWIVDDEAADVVRRIFAMTLEGYGPYQIATRLAADKIEIPAVHLGRHGEGVNQSKKVKDPYGWGSSTVVNILKRREYLGHTVNFKTRKHFKDKKSHYVDESEWTIFENTHPAIIDQETFDNVQRIRGNVKRYPDGWGEAAPLTGLMYCADCGGKMYVHRSNNGKRVHQYDMTLEEVKPWVSRVASKGVPSGLISKHIEPGFLLVDGTVLLESEKDENGFYIGGAGMDGMYLKTGTLYEPVRDDGGKVTSFRRMAGCLGWFNGEEQKIIFQYAINTPENLIEDLTAALPALRKSPQVYNLFTSTVEKLKQVPPGECQRLMADIRAAYKGREVQSIRERQKKAAQKKRRSLER